MIHFDLTVGCYSGYRGEQTPRHLQFGTRRVVVTRVLDQWLAPDHRYFKLAGDDGGIYLIRHETASGHWQLVQYRHATYPGDATVAALHGRQPV